MLVMKTILVVTVDGGTSEFIEASVNGSQTVAEVLRSLRYDYSSDWSFRVDGNPAEPNSPVTESNSTVTRERVAA